MSYKFLHQLSKVPKVVTGIGDIDITPYIDNFFIAFAFSLLMQ